MLNCDRTAAFGQGAKVLTHRVQEHFRCNVLHCSTECVRSAISPVDAFGKPKVRELDVAFPIHEDVLRLCAQRGESRGVRSQCFDNIRSWSQLCVIANW